MQKEFNSLVKSIIIYGFGNVSIKIIGLVLLPMYTNTHLLSVEEYGGMAILDISSLILISVFSLSLSSAYLRWYWDKAYFKVRKELFFTCFVTLTALATILAVSGCMCSRTLSSFILGNDSFYRAFSLMVIATSMQPLIDFTLTQMRSENKASFFVSANIARLIISLAATIYFLKYAGKGLSGIYEAQIIGNIAFFILTAGYIYRNMVFRFSRTILSEILKYSLPLALASLSSVLLVALDRFVLNNKTTPLDVGIYSQGYKIANTTKVFVISSIQLALAPAIFKIMNRPDNKEIYSKIMTWFTIVVVYFSLFLSLFGLEITKLFTTGKIYFDAYKLIPLFSLSIIFSMLKDVSLTGLQITKRTKIIGIILTGIAVFNLALNMTLVPLWGTYGSAVSSLVSQLTFFVIMYLYSQKFYKIPYRLDKIGLIIIIGAALYLFGSYFNNNSLEFRIAIKLFTLLLFPVFLFLFRILDRNEILSLLSTVKNLKSIFITNKKEVIPPIITDNDNI
jgi:O-antigen/teichoic acid export membrane protein